MTLVNCIHEALIDTDKQSLSASVELNRDSIFQFFNLLEKSNDNKEMVNEFVNAVESEMTETLFGQKTVSQHREYFVGSVRNTMSDCLIDTHMCTDNQLIDFCHDVMIEILKSQNKNLSINKSSDSEDGVLWVGTKKIKMNIALTYLEMTKAQGLSDRKAIIQICDACGQKLHSSYSEWSDETKSRPIPAWAVVEMQKRVAVYALQKLGIHVPEETALKLAEMLSPKGK